MDSTVCLSSTASSAQAQRELVRAAVKRLHGTNAYIAFSDHPRLGKPIVRNVAKVGMAIISSTLTCLASYAKDNPLGTAAASLAAAARATGKSTFSTKFEVARNAVEALV